VIHSSVLLVMRLMEGEEAWEALQRVATWGCLWKWRLMEAEEAEAEPAVLCVPVFCLEVC